MDDHVIFLYPLECGYALIPICKPYLQLHQKIKMAVVWGTLHREPKAPLERLVFDIYIWLILLFQLQ